MLNLLYGRLRGSPGDELRSGNGIEGSKKATTLKYIHGATYLILLSFCLHLLQLLVPFLLSLLSPVFFLSFFLLLTPLFDVRVRRAFFAPRATIKSEIRGELRCRKNSFISQG